MSSLQSSPPNPMSSNQESSNQLNIHQVNGRHMVITILVLSFFIRPLFYPDLMESEFDEEDTFNKKLEIIVRPSPISIISSIVLAILPIIIVISFTFYKFKVPNTLLINTFISGVFPTFVQIKIVSKILLFATTFTLYFLMLFVRTRKRMEESLSPDEDFMSVLFGSFQESNFQILFRTMQNTIWPFIFYAPVKETIKWLLVRKLLRRSLIQPITEDVRICTAIMCATGFATIPSIEKTTKWIHDKAEVRDVLAWGQVMLAGLFSSILEIGSTLYIALTVSLQKRSTNNQDKPQFWRALLVAILLHCNWPSIKSLYKLFRNVNEGTKTSVAKEVAEIPSAQAVFVVIVLCIFRIRKLRRLVLRSPSAPKSSVTESETTELTESGATKYSILDQKSKNQ